MLIEIWNMTSHKNSRRAYRRKQSKIRLQHMSEPKNIDDVDKSVTVIPPVDRTVLAPAGSNKVCI
jgi:hypothetical protein